ncbi:MAG: HD domain-containing phosphohydrolase [Syntrophomonadaceae bacterium]|nr:HD domain-containing phosphohydrolase [Syntrophomonadaceae bacterium]
MKTLDVNKLLAIGIALTKEKDYDRLFETILREAMEITSCDGGTLYVCNEDDLAFKIMITKSMGFFKGGQGDPVDLPPVKKEHTNVCAFAALNDRLVNIADVYNSEEFDFSGPRRYDAMTGYKTTSMLVVPMEDDHGDVIGVLQLINAQDENGNIIAFDPALEPVIHSLASQAAICLANVNYAQEIIALFDSFVRVMSTAIDARTPYNANHSRNMVRYGERFIDWLRETGHEWQFADADKRQFLMSVWLHDVGKLVIPLEVMDKESRLGKAGDDVAHRLEVIELLNRVHFLNGDIPAEQYERGQAEVSEARILLEKVNRAGFVPDATLDAIRELGQRTYTGADGAEHSWLTENELTALLVQKGTLTAEERGIMESHVSMTAKMLSEMNFSRDYRMVPEWAAGHHEFLNGCGYPHKLAGDAISKEVRLLTILDIFDALTARDRPYKPPMPTEKALAILDDMARDGQLDADILDLFKQSQAWEDEA